MRILQVGKYYPPVKGGMETVLREICEGLLERGHRVTALVAGTGGPDREEPLVNAGGSPAGRLIRAANLALINSQPVAPSLLAWLRRIVAQENPEIVHVHLPHPAACAACLIAMPPGGRARMALWYHADITRQRLGARTILPLLRLTLQRAAGIAVSSEALRRHSPHLSRFRGKVRVIPFGIDPGRWLAVRNLGGGPFIFVGRLVYYKGLPLLLAAMRSTPSAELAIVGEGPLRASLQAQSRRDGLEGRVRFLGEVSESRLCELMGEARALVLPSARVSETFGLVQLEAMAAGLPVISTQLPTGVADVNLDGVTGMVVPAGDAAALATAIRDLLADPERGRALGAAGRQRVQSTFSRTRMIDSLEAWYGELLSEPGMQLARS